MGTASTMSCIVEALAPTGHAVLNANDPLVVEMAAHCPGEVVFFAVLDLLDDGTHREGKVGAGVAIRDRVHVEVVDQGALGLERGQSAAHESQDSGAGAHSCRSSTLTLTSLTGMPP